MNKEWERNDVLERTAHVVGEQVRWNVSRPFQGSGYHKIRL
jgi:hypothetical protein